MFGVFHLCAKVPGTGACVRTIKPHLDQLGEGLVDEDEGDEEGEDLLGEAGDEADQEAALEGHGENHDEYQPEPDPHPRRQVFHLRLLTELDHHMRRFIHSHVEV